MKNGITELVFILDRSGSMAGLEGDTVGGFNAMLEQQKAQPGKCWVSTVLFDHESTVLHDRIPLEQVEPMTRADYRVRGSTALLDAVGGAIRHISNIHKYARPEDVPENTLFIITTDGFENASRRYEADTVRQMIRRQKELYGWEFIFLGANIDAVTTARRFGIDGRGELKEGYYADVVVFDPETIEDRATFAEPLLAPKGIDYVIVNGKIAARDGSIVCRNAGKSVRKI